MAYHIRRAEEADLPRILAIYAYSREFMARNGNPNQWGTTKPPRERVEQDIREGALYLVCGGDGIHGVFFFRVGEDPTYREIWDGDWSSRGEYGVIHRIASDGSGGILTAALAFCRERCRCIRIDTHRDNLVMQRALGKHGFRRCGIIRIEDGSERIAFDLLL